MDLMVWTWTGSTLDLVEVLQRINRGSLCSAGWVFISRATGNRYIILVTLYIRKWHINILLLQELVEAYAAEAKATGKPRLMLTAAVSAGKGTIDAGYEIAEIVKYCTLFWKF